MPLTLGLRFFLRRSHRRVDDSGGDRESTVDPFL